MIQQSVLSIGVGAGALDTGPAASSPTASHTRPNLHTVVEIVRGGVSIFAAPYIVVSTPQVTRRLHIKHSTPQNTATSTQQIVVPGE